MARRTSLASRLRRIHSTLRPTTLTSSASAAMRSGQRQRRHSRAEAPAAPSAGARSRPAERDAATQCCQWSSARLMPCGAVAALHTLRAMAGSARPMPSYCERRRISS